MRTTDQVTLDYALRYIAKGVQIFPVHRAEEDGTCSCGAKSCKTVGKHPAVPGEPKGNVEHATLDEKQVQRWFGSGGSRRGYNIAASCSESGYICLDVDPKNEGLDSLEQLIRDHAPLPDTWVEETGEDSEGNRGQHYWFLTPPGKVYKRRKYLGGYPGIDLLADGYAIVAPSQHVSGVRYETLTSLDDVCEAPQWVLDLTAEVEPEDVLLNGNLLASPTGIRPGGNVRTFLRKGGVAPGNQRAMACKAARALWGIWVGVEDAADLVFAALQKCEWSEDDWTENQVRRLVADEYAKQPKALTTTNGGVALATDLGRAERLLAFSRGNLKYDKATGEWITWDTTRWKIGSRGEPEQLVHAMTMVELQEAQLSEEAKEKRSEALKCQSRAAVANILGTAMNRPGFVCRSEDFDRDPFLLNCSNVVVDLRNGQRREQRREEMMSKACRFAYNPNATSKLWAQVISDATSGNEDLIDFLQLAFGYAATGDTREDAFFYLHGSGGTGKTTILEAVAYVMGSYSTTADPETFMLSQLSMGLSHRADLAALKDARLVISSEIAQGSQFSTSTLNRLTGRDQISARVPYAKAPLVFKPQWALFFAANHFPQVPGATRRDGFWRRVKVIPFSNELTPDQMNPVLPYLLAKDEHGEAILAWVVAGAMRWWDEYASKDRKMEVPDVVTREIFGMQEQTDELADFRETLIFDPDAVTTRADMHQYYLGWCEHVGTKMPKRPRQFGPLLRSSLEGYDVSDGERTVNGKRERCWIGVRF